MPTTGGGGGPSPRIPPRYRGLVMAASRATGLPSKIIATQTDYESSWRTGVTSPAGAEGILQFMPRTWAAYGHGSPFNARESFVAYARYMNYLLRQEKGDVRNALAAYNAGPGNLPAGYPYADVILSSAGYPRNSRVEPYKNPFRAVQGLTPERVDMGVDYSGRGTIFALGPGVITAAGHAWQGAVGAPSPGTWITERLTSGPLAGHQVYVAEDVEPLVRTGQRVTADTPLARFVQGSGPATYAIETGFAAPGAAGTQGETAAAAAGQSASGGDPGARPTAYGAAYSKWIKSLGGPPGIISGPVVGTVPQWASSVPPDVGVGLGGYQPPGPPGGLSGIVQGIWNIGQTIGHFADVLDWFLNPGHWVRILSFMAGSTLTVMGIWSLTHVGGDLPGAGLLTRPMALPIGVILVGTGGILLFVAFHNLPPDVTDVGSMLGWLRSRAKAQQAGLGQKAPA